MIIESVEMENFKSYSKRVFVKLKKGFTVIIGPNGSGKSNLGDAMLFVLGAKSNKAIRVDKAADFIHKSEPQIKRCSVTLTILSNENRYLLTREVINNGNEVKSNYYINKKRARYNDVFKLIDSFHIYLDSYSFVLQGDINNLIKMSGSERRKLFESMAGIESYKERIENAKNDITGLNENINILSANLSSIKGYLDKLDIDRQNARKYSDLKREIDEMDAYLKMKDKEKLDSEISLYEENIKKLSSEIEQFTEKKQLFDKEKIEKNEEIKEIEEKLDKLGGKEVKEIRKNIDTLNIKLTELKTKINIDNDEMISLEMHLKTSTEALDFQNAEIEKKRREKKNTETYLKTAENNINKIIGELEKFRIENYNNTKHQNELNAKLKEIDDNVRSINILIDNKKTENSSVSSEISAKNKELSIKEEKYKELQLKIKDLKWKIENGKDNISAYNGDINLFNKRLAELRKSLNDKIAKKSNNDNIIRQKEKELRGLNYSGNSSPSLREINSLMEKNIISGIYGQLRNLIEYEDFYANAVVVSGGSRLRSIVVENDYTAQRCIEILKEKKLGRLTFIPLNKITVPHDHEKTILLVNNKESMGFVRDFVKYDEKFKKAINFCFGDTIIMDTIEKARKNMGGVRIVTLEGDIFEPSGSITGGYIKNDEIQYNKISRLISELEEENVYLTPDINQLNSEVNSISSQFVEITKKRDIEINNNRNYETLLGESESLFENTKNDLGNLKNDMENLNEKRDKIEFDIKDFNIKLFNLNKEKDQIFSELKKLNPETREIEKQIEKELDYARAESKKFSDNLLNINNDINHFSERINDLNTKIFNYKREIEEKGKSLNTMKNQVQSSENLLEELKNKEYEIDSKSTDLYNRMREISNDTDRLSTQIRNVEDDINKKNLLIATLKGKIENLLNQVNELADDLVNINIPDYKMSIKEVKESRNINTKKIENLGPINQKAIQEYDEEYTKYSEGLEKYNTLINERNSLIELENNIVDEEKKAFLGLFDRINEEFKNIYSRLSGGGDATLQITNREDPLSAEVYIKAKPKGNFMIKIDALSGGEKSVAVLSLILAFQRKNPSPVYYLDEVDMFLDGYNAEQVGSLFRENAETSQIIMISLKGAVSKFATNILGVTTDKHGNTKIIEKNMEE